MEEIKAYHCDFCKKYSKSEYYMKKHEKHCFYNPVTKSCITCIHFAQKPYRVKTILGNNAINAIPTCKEGVEIACLTDKGKKLFLKTQCPLWENEEYFENSNSQIKD